MNEQKTIQIERDNINKQNFIDAFKSINPFDVEEIVIKCKDLKMKNIEVNEFQNLKSLSIDIKQQTNFNLKLNIGIEHLTINAVSSCVKLIDIKSCPILKTIDINCNIKTDVFDEENNVYKLSLYCQDELKIRSPKPTLIIYLENDCKVVDINCNFKVFKSYDFHHSISLTNNYCESLVEINQLPIVNLVSQKHHMDVQWLSSEYKLKMKLNISGNVTEKMKFYNPFFQKVMRNKYMNSENREQFIKDAMQFMTYNKTIITDWSLNLLLIFKANQFIESNMKKMKSILSKVFYVDINALEVVRGDGMFVSENTFGFPEEGVYLDKNEIGIYFSQEKDMEYHGNETVSEYEKMIEKRKEINERSKEKVEYEQNIVYPAEKKYDENKVTIIQK